MHQPIRNVTLSRSGFTGEEKNQPQHNTTQRHGTASNDSTMTATGFNAVWGYF